MQKRAIVGDSIDLDNQFCKRGLSAMVQQAVDSVKRGAISFFSGTILSRITGLVRDVTMAFVFGSDPAIAAFMVAYRLANVFRRLLGEGPLPSGFVPHFETLRREDEKSGARFFRDVFFSLLVTLLLSLFVLEVLFVLIGKIYPEASLLLGLSELMMPGVVFVCLYGVSSALLQCQKKFFLSSFSPALFNAVWISAVLLQKGKLPKEGVWSLAAAVVLGFFLQWAVLLPSMYKYLKKALSLREIFSFTIFPKEVRSVIKPFLFGLIGVAAVQINSALDALFARSASLEGPAYLWYAIRIEQVPVALFGVALASALLPALSRALANKNKEEFTALIKEGVDKTLGLMIPCTVGVFVLAVVGINLIYGRGSFSLEAVKETVYALWGYGAGLLPTIFVLLFAPIFYAKKDFKTPMIASLGAVFVNLVLNTVFVFGMGFGAFSVALATSLSAFCNMFFLRKRLGEDLRIFIQSKKSLLVSSMAGVGTVFFSCAVFGESFLLFKEAVFSRDLSLQFMQFFALSSVFAVQVGVYGVLFKVREITALIKR